MRDLRGRDFTLNLGVHYTYTGVLPRSERRHVELLRRRFEWKHS
jgi:hypothetical protein